MEESAVEKKSGVKDAIVCLLLSTLMYKLSLSTFLFAAPLMLYKVKHNRNKAALLLGLEALIVLALELLTNWRSFDSNISVAVFVIGLIMPMSLLVAGAIWLYAEKHRLEARIFLSLIPIFAVTAVSLVWFAVDRTLFNNIYDYYENAFAGNLGELLGKLFTDIDSNVLFSALSSAILSLVFPGFTLAVCATSFIYETGLHSREDGWEERVQSFEFPADFVWFFIASLALLLLSYFISAVPLWLMVLIMNTTGLFTVLYAIQGFTVVYSFFRKRMKNLKSMTLFIILFIIALVVPGINFIVVFGLPLLGLLESFFDLKKLGVKNEDYS